MCWMWLSAVFAEMNSRSEISRVVAPSAISRRTWVSRAVRPAAPRRLAGGRQRTAGEVDLVERVRRGVADVHRSAGRGEPLRRLLPELRVEPPAEIGEAGHVVGAPLFPGHRAEERLGDTRTVEALEERWQAGQRDDQLGHGAGAHEGLDRGAEETQRRLQLPVRGLQESGVARQEALEEAHVVLAEIGHCLVPGLERALRVRLRIGQTHDPQRVGEPVGVSEVARRRIADSVCCSASSTRPDDCRPSTYAAIPYACPGPGSAATSRVSSTYRSRLPQ